MNVVRSTASRFLAGVLAAVLAVVGLTSLEIATAGQAVADTAPPAGTPVTPSADGLPTTQIDGVAWQQAIVGDRVYVGGEFTTARPAGAAAGVSTVPRLNLLAYDITTGVLDAGWAPNPNAQVKAVAVSPDGTRLYVGGNFTSIAGASKYRIAAFDTATGALVGSFNAGTNSQVRAIAATDTTVYVGGIFTEAGGQYRTKLAAFSASTGAVLPWNPTVDDGSVSALAVSPDGTQVIAGGSFTSFNGSVDNGYGLARIDAVTGASIPYPVNSLVRNGTINGAITGLTGDGENVYGVGYTWGRSGGTLEGVFAADWDTGELTWVADCHGDSYAVYAAADIVYSASHYHYCGNIRSIPQEDTWQYQRANAFTKAVTQTVGREHLGYTNWEGNPAPEYLSWTPDLDTGTYTGQNQGPWAVTGNDDYVVWGGEFNNVNFRRQQGLVRFAVREIAPNDQGPRYTGEDFTPQLRVAGLGAVRISWTANADFDNEFLTYRVIRDGNTATPVWVGTIGSHRWDRPWMGFTDTGLAPGSTHSYRVTATDPFGNSVTSPTVSITATGTGSLSSYAQTVMADGASHYWRLGDGAGTTAVDSASVNDALTGTAMTRGVPGAISGDADTAFALTNSSGSRVIASTRVQATNTVTVEAWINTTSTTGGRIVGLGNSSALTGTSFRGDRHLYMSDTGAVMFGVSPGQNRAVASETGYNDGQWHHLVGTLGPDGVALYVDGAQVAANPTWRTGRNYTGFWRIGGDSLSSWLNQPSTINFTGSVDEVAVYPIVLSPEQIAAHHALGTSGVTPNQSPVASFTATVSNLRAALDGSGSADPDGTIASYGWDFGDGSTGTGATTSHTYATAGTYTVILTVTDDDGATGTTSQVVTVTAPPVNQEPVAAFTATPSALSVALDGSASADPDGTIASYGWDFGDGSTGTGATTSHTYATAGTYTVILTVTDDDGATGTTSAPVTVTDPSDPTAFALDTFSRTVSSGWGLAEVGGPWTLTGAASNFAVGAGIGTIVVPNPGWTSGARLTEVSQTETELRATVGLDKMPTGGGTDVALVGRALDQNQGYRLRLKLLATGVVRAQLLSVSGGTTATLAQLNLPGLTYAAGDQLEVRLQVTGASPTTLQAKVWQVGTTEPAGWTLSTTDSTAALQVPGGVGVYGYASSSATNTPQTLRVDNVWAGPPDTTPPPPPENQAPVAAFTAPTTGLSVSVDGSGSADPDGSIVSYAWDFGDGSTDAGVTTSHTYAAAGTYTISLTVADDDGATGATTQSVTVAAPGDPVVFALDTFARTATSSWGSAEVGGPWTLTGPVTSFAVGEGIGTITVPNPGWMAAAHLTDVAQTETEVRVTVALDTMPTGGGTDVSVVGRSVGTDQSYRLRLKLLATGVVRAQLLSMAGGTTTTLTQLNLPGLTYAAGDQLQVRLQVTGTSPTTLQAKVWRVGDTEPAGWTLSTTDSTAALQVPGGVGVMTYVSGTATNTPQTLRVDDLWAGQPTP